MGYALFYPAAYSERSTLLEPVSTFGVLVALLLTQGRLARSRVATAFAGAALALAVATKIWYVVPAALIALLLWNRRRILVLAGGFVATAAVTILPFFVAAPDRFVQRVVFDQLGRADMHGWPALRRIGAMLAVRTADAPSPHVEQVILLKTLGLLAVLVVLATVAFTMREARRYVVLTVAAMVVLLLTPSYFGHYGALLAPPLMIMVGAGVGGLVQLLRRPPLQVVLVTLALLGFALLNRHIDSSPTSRPIPAAALRPAAARVTGCVTSDDPMLLIELNVLSRDFDRGCEVWIDVSGWTYDRDKVRSANGSSVQRVDNPTWQRDILGYLRSGDAVIVHRAGTGLSDASKAALARGPVLARRGHWVLRAVPSSAG